MENINLEPVVSAAVTLLAAVITTFLVPYIKGKISEQQYEKLLEAVKTAVAAAEQLFSEAKSGPDKKQYVQELLTAQGFDVSEEKIDAMIEASVGRINGVEV